MLRKQQLQQPHHHHHHHQQQQSSSNSDSDDVRLCLTNFDEFAFNKKQKPGLKRTCVRLHLFKLISMKSKRWVETDETA